MVPRKPFEAERVNPSNLTESHVARKEIIYLMPAQGKHFHSGEIQSKSKNKSSPVDLTKTEGGNLAGRAVEQHLVY